MDKFDGSLYHPALIRDAYHPHVVAYYYKQWEQFDMPVHQHLAVEIMYVISGACVVEAQNEAIEMKKGEFIMLDSLVPHRLVVAEGRPCRMLNLEFVFTVNEQHYPSVRQLAIDNPSLRRLLDRRDPYYVYKDPNDVYRILHSLVVELDDRNRESDWQVQLLLGQLMLRVAQLIDREEELQASDGSQSTYVRKALEYIHQHYDFELKVEDIAAAVNLHPGYLHRIFKQQLGMTPVQYVTEFRMGKAKMLLTNTNIPVSDIADYVGLSNRQYFSFVFKKHTGQSPLEYRRSAESWVREGL